MTHARTRGGYSKRRPVKQSLKRLLLVPKHATARLHRLVGARRRVRVLLVAQSRLMEQYVTMVADLVPEGSDVRFYAPDREMRRRLVVGARRRVAPAWAPWMWWNLVVLAEHLPLVFPPMENAVLMSHGLVRAGHAPRGSFFYDRDRVLLNGVPVYAAICDPAERTAVEGEQFVPQIAGRVRVTGDLRVDRMLRCAADRPVSEVPRLLVMSTWGSDSLLESVGPELLDQLSRLERSGSLTVAVTCHPNLLEPSTSLRDWPLLLRSLDRTGVEVIPPSEPWEPVLAGADVVLTDHTSLCGTFALLKRPILPVVCTRKAPADDTFFARLVAESIPWDPSEADLESSVLSALERGFPAALEPMVDGMVDHLGHSRERFRDVFDEVVRGSGGNAWS